MRTNISARVLLLVLLASLPGNMSTGAQAAGELKGPVQIGAGLGPTLLQSNRNYLGLLVHARAEFYPAAQPFFSMGPG
ncbi:MAG: hypothetical protein AAB425_08715, partial [Bdellovibrionota bacterium]